MDCAYKRQNVIGVHIKINENKNSACEITILKTVLIKVTTLTLKKMNVEKCLLIKNDVCKVVQTSF